MIILIFIIIFITLVLGFTLKNSVYHKTLLRGQFLECIWTLFPVVILVQIALPSLVLLYLMENPDESFLDLKVQGHQ